MAYQRALIVGAGGMGRTWARAVSERADVELVGWIDIRDGVANEAADDLGLTVGHLGTDLEKALAEARADFVVDVTVPEAHRPVTVSALSHGLPVIGEKPMASSMEEARAMVEASDRSGKLYMISQSRRYHAGLQAYRKLIDRELGMLGILNADFYIGAHFGGFRDEMPSPLLLDMAIHTFDAARYLSGADPVAVYAEEFNPPWSWYSGDACASGIFEMTGGLRFTYRGSWCAEGLHTSWEGDWRTVGERGTALWAGEGAPRGEVVSSRDGFHSTMSSVSEAEREILGGINGSLDEFLRALSSGDVPNGECHDNIKSLAMVFAAIDSAARRERVTIAG